MVKPTFEAICGTATGDACLSRATGDRYRACTVGDKSSCGPVWYKAEIKNGKLRSERGQNSVSKSKFKLKKKFFSIWPNLEEGPVP